MYYWPTLFRDSVEWVAKCEACQHFIGRPNLASLLVKPMIIEEHFHQWGIEFIRELNLSSSAGHNYVLTTTDYFTKWVEAVPI
ncbi:hypothetical protein KI387_036812, partial [Taxus chinensis]